MSTSNSKDLSVSLAIWNEDVDLIREYIDNGEGGLDINELDGSYNARTPLHYALKWNASTAIMELLLGKGADMDIKDEHGRTPLMAAAERQECIEKLQCLLKHGAKVNNCNEKRLTALHFACSKGNVAAVRILLEHGADIHARDKRGRTPLQTAAKACKHDKATTCLQALLDHGADILTRDNHGRTLLHNAIRGKSLDLDGRTPFLVEIMSFLLDKKKMDLNATDKLGNTVLHSGLRIYLGGCGPGICPELTRVLLAHGAQLQIQNRCLETVFHLAIKYMYRQSQEIVRLLLAHLDMHGIDQWSVLSMTDDKGQTALHYARNKGGAQSLLEQLTNNGEDILPCCHDLFFATNGEGRTLSQEVQTDLECDITLNGAQDKLLLLDYLHSFTANSLSVPESAEYGASAMAVRLNPLLNDFQCVIANQMLRMSLTCPAVSTNVMNELPESIKLVTMGYLAPADVMKRNRKIVKTGIHDDDENRDDDENHVEDDSGTVSKKKRRVE